MTDVCPRPRYVSAFVVLVLVLGACGGGGDGAGNTANGSTTTVGGEGDANGNGPDKSADGNGNRNRSDPLDAADAGQSPSGIDPSKPVERTDVPAEGRYQYEYRRTGKATSRRTLDVGNVGSGDGWLRQLTSFNSETTADRALVVWLADRHYVELEQRAREDQVAAPCEWDPGFVVLELPLEVGNTWESDSECATEAAERRRTMEAEVTGTRTIEIGGAPVETFVIEQTTTTTTDTMTTPAIQTVETQTSTDLYSADRRLLVESSGTTTGALDGVPRGVPQTFTLTLLALSPTPPP